MARPTLFENLDAVFKTDHQKYDLLRRSIFEFIHKDQISRFFNNFPPLLCENDMTALKNRYVDILRHYKNRAKSENLVGLLVKEIASIGAGEILDTNGEVSADFLRYFQLMGLKNEFKENNIYLLLSSYVCTILLDIQTYAKTQVDIYQDAHLQVNHYVNQNIRPWIMAGMKTPNRNIELNDPNANFSMVSHYPIEHPRATIGIIGGVIAICGLVATLVAAIAQGGVSPTDNTSHPGPRP